MVINELGLELEHSFGELPVIELMFDYLDYSSKLVDEIIQQKQSHCGDNFFKKV